MKENQQLTLRLLVNNAFSEEERKRHTDNQLCLNYGKRTVEIPALVKTQQAATTSTDYFSEREILS
jgi:hypothetical protein